MTRSISHYLYDPITGKALTGVRGEAFRMDPGASVATATSDNDGLLQFTGLTDSLQHKVMAYVPGDIRVFDERTTPSQFVALTTPLTSTSWDGDPYSPAGSTLIDLSAVFAVPAGVKAVLARLQARDSAVWGTSDLYVALNGANDVAKSSLVVRTFGGDVWADNSSVVPCNSDGDIYYAVNASGASTMDVYIWIHGYWI